MQPAVLILLACLGAEPASDGSAADKKLSAARLAYLKESAAEYAFVAPKDRKPSFKLHAEPLLRWNNPVAEEHDAVLFLWTDHGRPAAAAQFFVRDSLWMHEFQSLSTGPFTAQRAGKEVWRPAKPGVEFAPLAEAPPPAETAVARMQQMRKIAEEFSASVEFQYEGQSHYELRLLAKPVYRYTDTPAEIIDGAMFAFVQGTNPEVLLMIEAARAKSGAAWQYALARMTSYPAEASRAGKSVWKVSREKVPTDDLAGTYFFTRFTHDLRE